MSIDTSVLDSYREFMEEDAEDFIKEILDEFYSNSNELMMILAALPGDAELAAFTRAAHTLKSTSATVGAMALSALAAKIEQLAKTQSLDEIAPLLPELKTVFADAKRQLEEIYS